MAGLARTAPAWSRRPRSLVRTGMDLGPVAGRPTASPSSPRCRRWPRCGRRRRWPSVRLLIFGGEACPPELAARLAAPGREVWNTYGPTEATVVACGAPLDGDGPVRIGLPLDGWDLAVVDADRRPVAAGETGELIIGGVGLARYLDPAKDAEKYAPDADPRLGTRLPQRRPGRLRRRRACSSSGRADDQVKLGGRRIELGEIDAALRPCRASPARRRPCRRRRPATRSWSATSPPSRAGFDPPPPATCCGTLPAPLVPRLRRVDTLPTRTSGKVDRDALPWPLPAPAAEAVGAPPDLPGGRAVGRGAVERRAGHPGHQPDADFFADGGGSLAAAQLVSALRAAIPPSRWPTSTPTPHGRPDRRRPGSRRRTAVRRARTRPHHRRAPGLPDADGRSRCHPGRHALADLPDGAEQPAGRAVADSPARRPSPGGGWAPPGWSSSARRADAALRRRRPAAAAQVVPGHLPALRAGCTCGCGWPSRSRTWPAPSASPAPLGPLLRAGARGEDRPRRPPALAAAGHRPADPRHRIRFEPEVDLSGCWIDGDRVHIGAIRIGPGASVWAPQHAAAGATVGAGAQVAPGSAVVGKVKAGQLVRRLPRRAPRQGPALVAGLPGDTG